VSSATLLLLCPSLVLEGAEPQFPVVGLPLPAAVEFVGVTTATIKPGSSDPGGSQAGILPLARACQAQFRQSHVCSSADILQSGRTPAFPAGVEGAWVSPSIVSVLSDMKFDSFGNVNHLLVDASGLTLHSTGNPDEGMNCRQWGEEYSLGLTVDGRGLFSTSVCNVARPVACCVGRAVR
jgi:hypothetical protein